jgi:hypothetical protein
MRVSGPCKAAAHPAATAAVIAARQPSPFVGQLGPGVAALPVVQQHADAGSRALSGVRGVVIDENLSADGPAGDEGPWQRLRCACGLQAESQTPGAKQCKRLGGRHR